MPIWINGSSKENFCSTAHRSFRTSFRSSRFPPLICWFATKLPLVTPMDLKRSMNWPDASGLRVSSTDITMNLGTMNYPPNKWDSGRLELVSEELPILQENASIPANSNERLSLLPKIFRPARIRRSCNPHLHSNEQRNGRAPPPPSR